MGEDPGGADQETARARAAFAALAAVCARRFLAQNGRVLRDDCLARYTESIWAVVEEAGWPRPLADDDPGQAAEMPAGRATELVARVISLAGLDGARAELDTLTRQLVKACLQPEFRECRESYHETVNGACRRQQLEKARERVSGSHCVDCPYWIALEPGPHAALLESAWREGGCDRFRAHRDVFLPEDFRALRRFVHAHIRARR